MWTGPHPASSGTEASMESESTVYVGLDVHKDSIMVAYAIGMGEPELLAVGRTTISLTSTSAGCSTA